MPSPERQWVPSCFVDEVTPTPRSHPDKWITPPSTDTIAVVTDEDQELVTATSVGETMNFDWVVDFGEYGLTMLPDGTYTAEAIPAEATHFVLRGDPDTLAFSIDDFARNMIDIDGPFEKTETLLVTCYQWSEDPVTFRLIQRDGRLTFVEYDGGNNG